jgi:ABC-type multidrug transport system fused ATPase/permease subunit
MSRRQLSSLRKLVALASPDTPMLRGTVEQNIRYGARVDGDDACSILAMAGYEALAAELPDGIHTRVGPGGRGLSLGQQRRVMLMRALLRRPLVLLLDEIESGLDVAGQRLLSHVFEQFDGSIVMATHSEGWQRRCDVHWALPGPPTSAIDVTDLKVRHG